MEKGRRPVIMALVKTQTLFRKGRSFRVQLCWDENPVLSLHDVASSTSLSVPAPSPLTGDMADGMVAASLPSAGIWIREIAE